MSAEYLRVKLRLPSRATRRSQLIRNPQGLNAPPTKSGTQLTRQEGPEAKNIVRSSLRSPDGKVEIWTDFLESHSFYHLPLSCSSPATERYEGAIHYTGHGNRPSAKQYE